MLLFLVSTISDDDLAVIFIFISLYAIYLCNLDTFKFFYLSLVLSNSTVVYFFIFLVVGVCWASWIFECRVPIKFGKVSIIISLFKCFSLPWSSCFLHNSNYIFCVILYSLKSHSVLFISFSHFSLCILFWLASTAMSSSY